MYKTRKYFNGAIDTSLLDLASEVFEVLEENPDLKQTISEKLSENHREELNQLIGKIRAGEEDE